MRPISIIAVDYSTIYLIKIYKKIFRRLQGERRPGGRKMTYVGGKLAQFTSSVHGVVPAEHPKNVSLAGAVW